MHGGGGGGVKFGKLGHKNAIKHKNRATQTKIFSLLKVTPPSKEFAQGPKDPPPGVPTT
jgi:hypothetical protein